MLVPAIRPWYTCEDDRLGPTRRSHEYQPLPSIGMVPLLSPGNRDRSLQSRWMSSGRVLTADRTARPIGVDWPSARLEEGRENARVCQMRAPPKHHDHPLQQRLRRRGGPSIRFKV